MPPCLRACVPECRLCQLLPARNERGLTWMLRSRVYKYVRVNVRTPAARTQRAAARVDSFSPEIQAL